MIHLRGRRGPIASRCRLAAILVACAATVHAVPEATAATPVAWAGAGSGSASLAYAAAVAQIVNKHESSLKLTVLPTSGAIEVVRLLDRGQVQAGVGNSATGYDAAAGRAAFEGKPVKGLSYLWIILRGATHVIVPADSPARSVADLRGKRITLSPIGSTSYQQGIDMLRAYGLSRDDVRIRVLPFADQVTALKDGTVDAIIAGGWRSPNFQELASLMPIRLLGMTDDAWGRLKAQIPPGYYVRVSLPPNMYKGQDYEVPTFTIVTFWITSTETLDEASAYKLVKAFWDNKAEADAIHPMIRDTDVEMQALGAPVPMHPGAARYFREKGILK